MSCPTNVAEWHVAQWTKMSHRRSLSECANCSKKNKEHNGKLLDDNADRAMCTNTTTIRKYHEEDLNPWTKQWRESLRSCKYSYMPNPEPTRKKKKKVRWSKQQMKAE